MFKLFGKKLGIPAFFIVTGTNGCTKNSNVIAVTVPCRLGSTDDDNAFTEISVYPNPSSGNFHISSSRNLTQDDIVITDLAGKIIPASFTPGANNLIIISGIAPGVYLLSINNNNERKQFKIVKTE